MNNLEKAKQIRIANMLIGAIKDLRTPMLMYQIEKDVAKEALESYIKTLEQQPKTGRWIDDKCSVCGKGIDDLIDSPEWYRNEEPNFCPFCGLRLVESKESDE